MMEVGRMKRLTILLVTVLIFAFASVGCENISFDKEPSDMQIRSICELATLKCYFHNVAKSNKVSDSWFKKDREFWIEYTGVAKIGIDVSKVNMKFDKEIVTVTLPNAELLGIDILDKDLNEDSYIHSGDGLIKNKITADDQSAAINTAQNDMAKSVRENTALLISARDRAQRMIENYINKLGELSGVDYKINCVYKDSSKA